MCAVTIPQTRGKQDNRDRMTSIEAAAAVDDASLEKKDSHTLLGGHHEFEIMAGQCDDRRVD